MIWLLASLQAGAFAPPESLSSIAPVPRKVEYLDVDRDGDLDVVVSYAGGRELLWFEALAPGEYGRVAVLADPGLAALPPISVTAMTIVDVDNDPWPELVVSTSLENELLLFPGTGPARFGAPVSVGRVSGLVYGLMSSDLDQDGDEEVITFGISPATGILENLGGALATPRRLTLNLSTVRAQQIADVDRDGDLDIVTTEQSGEVAWWRNDGLLSNFARQTIDSDPSEGRHLVVDDLDGDGTLDVVGSATDLRGLRVHLGVGDGTFAAPVEVPFSGPLRPEFVAVDIELDHDVDLVLFDRDRGQGRLFENSGNATFSLQPTPIFRVERDLADLRAVDVNGDMAKDVALADTGSILGWLGVSANGLETMLRPIARRVPDVVDMVAGDLDGDADAEIIVGSGSSGIWRYEGTGAGDFLLPTPVHSDVVDVRAMDGSDLNADGIIDLVTRDSANRIQLSFGGVGEFGAPLLLADFTVGPSIGAMFGPVLRDVDGDGDLDVLTGTPTSGELLVYEQTTLGVFAAPQPMLTGGRRIADIEFVDLFRNGTLDLLVRRVAGATPQMVEWFEIVQGSPVFRDIVVSSLRAGELMFADAVGGQGNPDVVWTTEDGDVNEFRGLLAFAGPTFQTERVLHRTTRSVRSKDVVLPGLDDVDFAHVEFDIGREYVVLSDWNLAATSATTHVVDHRFERVSSMRYFDADGDYDRDLVIADRDAGDVVLLRSERWTRFGDTYCTGVANATGQLGRLGAMGSPSSFFNNVTLAADRIPPHVPVLFLTSRFEDQRIPPGSVGTLCLGASVGRLATLGVVEQSGSTGEARKLLDLNAWPAATGTTSVMFGELWRFQVWHRDSTPTGATSNFTLPLAIAFE